ncbi:response regulator transcription factor [Actinokineospora iranica]|uniref:response regulator transcription factor n=1 Tax=Actinokineospora iranica TaxID=1271860 RepID=UPI0011138050|nr:response regulator transcription factor [Actinokineospora iranica]
MNDGVFSPRPVRVAVAAHGETAAAALAALIMRSSAVELVGYASTYGELHPLVTSCLPEVVLIDSGLACAHPEIGLGEYAGAVLMILSAGHWPPAQLTLKTTGLASIWDSPAELTEAIRHVRSGIEWVSPNVLTRSERQRVGVSSRESEVLVLIADGNSLTEIAKRLWITERTVKYHVASLKRKLSARDRAHLVALSFQAGLLHVNCPERQCLAPIRSVRSPRASASSGADVILEGT